MGQQRGSVKTLIVTEVGPSATFGTGQRMLLWQKIFADFGEVRLLTLTADGQPGQIDANGFVAPTPFDYRASRLDWIKRNVSGADYRADARLADTLRSVRSRYPFDLALFRTYRTTPLAPVGEFPVLLDIDEGPAPHGRLNRLLWPYTRRLARNRARQFDRVYVIRDDDRAMLGLGSEVATRLVPGLSCTATPQAALADSRGALFVGSMKWAPNLRAVEAMIAAGVPQVLAARGGQLRLVGEGTERFADVPGVNAAGFVDDLTAEYAAAAVVLCPVTGQRGANIKLAEAIQFGCAVLASGDSAQAYATVLEPGRDLAVFAGTAAFATDLAALIDDPARCAALRAQARARAADTLNLDVIARAVQQDCLTLLAARP